MTAIPALVTRLRALPSATGAAGAPLLVAALLLVLMVWRAVDLVSNRNPALPAEVVPVPVRRSPAADIASVLSARLFGGTDVAGGSVVAAVNLVLAGVIADEDPARGVAMLGPAAESIALYRVGEEVPSGARLKSVFPTYVLLQRGDQSERLEMQALQPGSGAPILASNDPQERQQAVARLQAQIPLEPGKLLRTQLVRNGGRLQGYRIYPGTAQKTFERSGLQRGDVVVSVNGHAAGDPSGQGDLISVLQANRRARVVVNRNGMQQELQINLDDLT